MDQSDLVTTRSRILDVAVSMFAAAGYESVSLRAIAKAVQLQAPSLYNHFPDKQSLYLAAIEHVFADKAKEIGETARGPGKPIERLRSFIESFTRLMANDSDFRRLLQRELLDGDEVRLRLVAEHVFQEPFLAISEMAQELAPDCDPHMLAISMTGLVLFHFETAPVRRFLPGPRAEHDDPSFIAAHVTRLLSQALELDR